MAAIRPGVGWLRRHHFLEPGAILVLLVLAGGAVGRGYGKFCTRRQGTIVLGSRRIDVRVRVIALVLLVIALALATVTGALAA